MSPSSAKSKKSATVIDQLTKANNQALFLQLAGRKHRQKLGSQLQDTTAACDEQAVVNTNISSFAKAQLEKLGWTEGEGLGKRKDGISRHIQVTKRSDVQAGLGQTQNAELEQLQIGNEWWKSSVGDTLAKLGKKKKSKKKDKKQKDRKRIFTDEELFEATGGARFGTKGKGKQHTGKLKRAEKEVGSEGQPAMEWDGMAAPKVILSSSSSKKKTKKEKKTKKRKRQNNDSDCASSKEDKDNDDDDDDDDDDVTNSNEAPVTQAATQSTTEETDTLEASPNTSKEKKKEKKSKKSKKRKGENKRKSS